MSGALGLGVEAGVGLELELGWHGGQSPRVDA